MSPPPRPALDAVLASLALAGVPLPISPSATLEQSDIHSLQALIALAELQRGLGLGTALLKRLVALGLPLGQHTPEGIAEILAQLLPPGGDPK
ncbi:MAG: hypothetical protein FJ086_20830 [Deltaproteobacteria bacterium]|nr:hypothetical protein [Deltaproteobacteria bacterium]